MTVNVYCKITRVSDTEVNKQTSTVCYYGIRLYGKAVEYQGFIYKGTTVNIVQTVMALSQSLAVWNSYCKRHGCKTLHIL